jgi:hypothetical protein
MTEVLVPLASTFTLTAWPVDVFGSCILQPSVSPPGPDDDIFVPVPPGTDPGDLPIVAIIDTSPDQIIGCILDTGNNAQVRINSLFPDAISGDGVLERRNDDVWVYDGTLWNNVGPNPGPTIQDVTNILAPYNEITLYTGQIRLGSVFTRFDYALELLTELTAVVRTRAVVRRQTWVLPPVAGISLAGLPPVVRLGYSAQVPAVAVTVAGEVPEINTGKTMQPPVAVIDFAVLDVNVLVNIASGSAFILTPSADITTAALPVNVSAGVNIGIPLVNTELTAIAPSNGLKILTGTAAPLLGAGGAVTFTGWDRIQNADDDDAFIEVSGWPFTFTIDSTGYTSAFVGSNTYITFGAGSENFNNLSASNPNLRKIHFGASDNSYQRVFKKSETLADGSSIMRIRYEGTANTTGTPGSPNIVAEFAFYQPRYNSKQWIELRVGNHSRTAGLFMIANASTSYASATTIAANSSWVFEGNSAGTSWTLTSNRYIA